MSIDDSLPRIDDLPAGDGFDRRAVEEALSAYQSRVRELETAVRVLRSPRTAPVPAPACVREEEAAAAAAVVVGVVVEVVEEVVVQRQEVL